MQHPSLNMLGGAASIIGTVSMFNWGNPDSWINGFSGGEQPEDYLRKVKKDFMSGAYVEINYCLLTGRRTKKKKKELTQFFNAVIWTGNFRITPFRWTELVDPNEDKAGQFIEEELSSNEGATKIIIGDFDCAHYRKDILQDEDEFLMYYWVTGKSENLFICSFTINKKEEGTIQNTKELKIVEDMIKSIEIN